MWRGRQWAATAAESSCASRRLIPRALRMWTCESSLQQIKSIVVMCPIALGKKGKSCCCYCCHHSGGWPTTHTSKLLEWATILLLCLAQQIQGAQGTKIANGARTRHDSLLLSFYHSLVVRCLAYRSLLLARYTAFSILPALYCRQNPGAMIDPLSDKGVFFEFWSFIHNQYLSCNLHDF